MENITTSNLQKQLQNLILQFSTVLAEEEMHNVYAGR